MRKYTDKAKNQNNKKKMISDSSSTCERRSNFSSKTPNSETLSDCLYSRRRIISKVRYISRAHQMIQNMAKVQLIHEKLKAKKKIQKKKQEKAALINIYLQLRTKKSED